MSFGPDAPVLDRPDIDGVPIWIDQDWTDWQLCGSAAVAAGVADSENE